MSFKRKGQNLEFYMSSYEARAAQHEIDHLDGKLFLDRLVNKRNAPLLKGLRLPKDLKTICSIKINSVLLPYGKREDWRVVLNLSCLQ